MNSAYTNYYTKTNKPAQVRVCLFSKANKWRMIEPFVTSS